MLFSIAARRLRMLPALAFRPLLLCRPLLLGPLALVAIMGCGGNSPDLAGQPDAAGSSSGEELAASGIESGAISSVPLRVIVEDGSDLVPLLQTSWAAVSEQPLEINSVPSDALLSSAAACDVIICRTSRMGDLQAAKAASSLPSVFLDSPAVKQDSLLSALKTDGMLWGSEFYSVPMGTVLPVLWGDADFPLETLSSWEAYGKAVAALPEGQAAEPLAPGWAALAFLSRAASQTSGVWLFDRQSLQPTLTAPPYLRALQQLAADRAAYPEQLMTPSEVWQALATGQLRVGIGWPTQLEEPTAESSAQLSKLQMRPLPQGAEVYVDGWQPLGTAPIRPVLSHHGSMGLIASSCRQTSIARSFLAWLVSRETHAQLSANSDLFATIRESSTQSDEAEAGLLTRMDPWRERYDLWLVNTLTAGEVVPSLRLPGAEAYYAELDAAVQEVLAGTLEPAAALTRTTQRWEALTEQFGRQKQLSAWRQSQGMRGR